MSVPVTTASLWPARAAYAASAIFLAASGSINTVYGWQKGSDVAGSLTWAAVSAGVAVVFALSWPALIRSVDARRWSAALIALAGLLLAGSYSITAALGSAAGNRYTAASTEQTATDARKRAQAAYDAAQAELTRIEPARSVAEFVPLVEAAKSQCRVRVDSNSRQTVCAKPSGLLAELGRAQRRSELQAQAERASTALASGSVRPANTDARALARYLSAVGLEATPERLNDLLTLLAVVTIEAGGGLALALGLALTPAAQTPAEQPAKHPRTPAPDAPDTQASAVRPSTDRSSSVAEWLALQGGNVQTSMRRLAVELGRSPSAVHDELRRLVAAGVVTMASSPRGTLVCQRAN